MIFKKIKNNKQKVYPAKLKRSGGFVLLFAVMISSIILAIALGIANISLKEMKFTVSAKDTNDAFFAADIGAECALISDKTLLFSGLQDSNDGTVSCLGRSISFAGPSWSGDWWSSPWEFQMSGLGSEGRSCADVVVTKVDISGVLVTTVTSKGYNNGGEVQDACTPNSKSVERELQVTF